MRRAVRPSASMRARVSESRNAARSFGGSSAIRRASAAAAATSFGVPEARRTSTTVASVIAEHAVVLNIHGDRTSHSHSTSASSSAPADA
ncbi:MAG: hypothetical protein ACXVAO_16735, partial [Vulcanimicrobiaceae bacterium]